MYARPRRLLWGISSLILALSVADCGEGSTSTPRDSARVAPVSSEPIGTNASLGGATVARVGGVGIDRDIVGNVAHAQKLTVAEAARILVDEELLAQAAHRLLDARPFESRAVQHRIDATIARALVTRLTQSASAAGPYTDAEIAAAMGDDWVDLDHAETRVVVHALVPSRFPDAEKEAKSIYSAVVGIADKDRFIDVASAFVLPNDARPTVEVLPAFGATGQLVGHGQSGGVVLPFAVAAFALEKVGDTSMPIETSFGWHVIRLLEIRPEHHATREEKLRVLATSLVRTRMGGRYQAIIDGLTKRAEPTIVGDSSLLMKPRFDRASGLPPTRAPEGS